MPLSPRVIRLRRPPVVALQEGVFVPDGAGSVMDAVEERWRKLCVAKPGLYDGQVTHVLGVHRNGHGGAVIHAVDCAYRFHGVQDEHFDVGMRGLGVKGIVICEGMVLLGRRSAGAATYPDMWQFVPAGVMEPGADPACVIERELSEETGLSLASAPTATAILYDATARTWDIVYRLHVHETGSAKPSEEHQALEWAAIESLTSRAELSPVASQMRCMVPELRTGTVYQGQPHNSS